MKRILLQLFFATVLTSSVTYAQNGYVQTNLVSDIPGLAAHTDPNLVNPWGIASSAGSPFWVSDNGTNVSTLYNTSGTPQGLVVSVPPSAPTGVVFNGTTAFNSDLFLFATEAGTIDGWRGALGTTAEILFTSAGAVYKGIATGTLGTNTYIYATDFAHGLVTVLPSSGAPGLAGNFTDPSLPAGYSPFNVQNIGGSLLVTYAVKAPGTNDDLAGPGNGIVDRFDLNGIFLQRLASNGPLNSPWGLALAPANFGTFSNDLLVGNFGDGRINAFNPITGAFLGTLDDTTGNPLTIEGLWGLRVGNGGNGGNPNFVYFAAGIPGPEGEVEDHGLFGSIASINAVPDSGSAFILLLVAFGAVALCARLPQVSNN
jgi:uncharacterized protein (TIGR03118 family)